jgi:HAE1 family hydrophobic/amphiphilic exporter-1/multidrug efflux pump
MMMEAMNEIKTKVLDDTFTTDLGGESRDFVESSSNTLCLLHYY